MAVWSRHDLDAARESILDAERDERRTEQRRFERSGEEHLVGCTCRPCLRREALDDLHEGGRG